jgi:hypothetical protein
MKWPFHLWLTNYQEEIAILLLDILTTKNKRPFHLWFTDYEEEMAKGEMDISSW